MKRFFNRIHHTRVKVFTGKHYDYCLSISYFLRNFIGYIRGLFACCAGKIEIRSNTPHRLILGMNTSLIIRPGSAIILSGENADRTEKVFYNNPIFPHATTIGLAPHYISLDPPAHSRTCIDLDNSSTLIMEQNTIILSGTYITANHGAEIFISENSYLSQEVIINARTQVFIGKNVMLGHQTRIIDYDAHDIIPIKNTTSVNTALNSSKPVIIEDNVWTGFKTTILKGVRIGRGSIIGANSCVTSDIPPNSIAVGNPARVIREGVTWQR